MSQQRLEKKLIKTIIICSIFCIFGSKLSLYVKKHWGKN